MSSSSSKACIQPRIIIHGGAGNITPENLPSHAYQAYRTSLLAVLQTANDLLAIPGATALDVATHAVTLLENDPLFNAGKGAVFTRAGTIELEASVMVSHGYRKRGVGCMLLKRVKNPIKLAREMLVRGEEDDGGGAYGYCQLSGPSLEELARSWGLEMCENDYFFTKKRWDEHKRGLEKDHGDKEHSYPISTTYGDDNPMLESHEYLPQGTVGAVVLDSYGDLCVATSTGGITNKLPGRIGDTPTIGAGFWAEEWREQHSSPQMIYKAQVQDRFIPIDRLSRGDMAGLITSCFPGFGRIHQPLRAADPTPAAQDKEKTSSRRHAVAISGTGNGDSFLRLNAARTAAAGSRYSTPHMHLSSSVSQMVGPDGAMQHSAGDRWRKTGEGEGGMIGIELFSNKSSVVFDFNCGGMFRAWVDERGTQKFMVFRDH